MEKNTDAKDKNKASAGSSYSRLQRILAMAGLLIIALLFVLLFVLLLTGGSTGAILSVLFCLIVIPCVVYGIKLYTYFLSKRRDEDNEP